MTHTRPPLTQPLDYYAASNSARRRSSASQRNTWNINAALPWVVIALVALVACTLSGVSIGLSVGARDSSKIAERETRLMRLEVDELKVALATQGIKTHEGSKP